jgi:benzylsuccinate CoA-transferase BbsF subunit
LKLPAAKDLALRLVAVSDIAAENFGPGVMDSLGLGYEALSRAKSDIIMMSMPAAGLTGPLKGVRTYGMSLSSITGLDSTTGYVGGGPLPFENAFADPLGGVVGAFGAIVALNYRKRTGKGQHVDYSQQEGVMQMVGPALMDYFLTGRVAEPMGNRHPLRAGAPHGVFPCAGDDRWISIAVLTEDEWAALVRAMGAPEWSLVADFASAGERVAHIDALHERVAEWTGTQDDRELAEQLQAQGVAASPVLNVADLLNDPFYRARGTFIEVRHPLGFDETIYGAYVKTSRTEPAIRPGPMIGQDNDHVFLEILGVAEKEYRRYIEDGVIY